MTHKVIHSIMRVKNPSKKDFLELYKQHQPFIINGVANHWDAYKKWSNDYLVEVCGNNAVPVETYTPSFFQDYNYALDNNFSSPPEMKFKDYIDIISRNQKDDLSYYMAQVDFQKFFPDLTKDIIYPEYFTRKPMIILFWFGFSNKTSASVTGLHFDVFHNIFVQIRGRKRFLLFPPLDYLSFYPPLDSSLYSPGFSKVDPDNPDFESFPNFPWQEKREVTLEAGEILYLPPFWWHHVKAVDENISLSFWYLPNFNDFFVQQKTLSTFLKLAPYTIPHLIHSRIRRRLEKLTK
jgi:hypothetical protein